MLFVFFPTKVSSPFGTDRFLIKVPPPDSSWFQEMIHFRYHCLQSFWYLWVCNLLSTLFRNSTFVTFDILSRIFVRNLFFTSYLVWCEIGLDYNLFLYNFPMCRCISTLVIPTKSKQQVNCGRTMRTWEIMRIINLCYQGESVSKTQKEWDEM